MVSIVLRDERVPGRPRVGVHPPRSAHERHGEARSISVALGLPHHFHPDSQPGYEAEHTKIIEIE